MIKYNLFLDDFRYPMDCLLYRTKYMPQSRAIYSLEDWVVARSYDEFVKEIKERFSQGSFPGCISFDHDLADEHYGLISKSDVLDIREYYEQEDREMTGRDCAKWLVEFCIEKDLELPAYWIHSANPGGSDRINEEMKDWYRYQERFKNK